MPKQLNTGGHDLERVKEIYQSVGWYRPNRDWDRLMQSHEKSDFAMGWYDRDQLVGYITALSDGLYVFVSTLIVHADFQGQGIGKALIASLEEHYP